MIESGSQECLIDDERLVGREECPPQHGYQLRKHQQHFFYLRNIYFLSLHGIIFILVLVNVRLLRSQVNEHQGHELWSER